MANYDPADARMYLQAVRRQVKNRDNQAGFTESDGNAYVLDFLDYYRVVFNTDVAGEQPSFFEAFSDRFSTVNPATGDTDINLHFPYPCAGIEIVSGGVGDGSTHIVSGHQ